MVGRWVGWGVGALDFELAGSCLPGVRGNFDFFEIVVTGVMGLNEAGVNPRAMLNSRHG